MLTFLDTSALLHGQLSSEEQYFISALTLSELEHIKTSNKSEDVKYKAREAIRFLLDKNSNITVVTTDNKKVNKMLKKHRFLSDINDHRIICEAALQGIEKRTTVNFITCDAAQYFLAKRIPILLAQYENESHRDEQEWQGWNKYNPDDKQLANLYTSPDQNVLNCLINEYAEIYVDEKLSDVLFWNGEKYRPLKYKEFTSILGERIKPRNLEQKMYMDLLQNKDIPIKLCVAKFGTGKSFLALNYALHEIQNGRFDKIVFVKNNLEVKGAGRLGTLPGDTLAKLYPWLLQIEDMIGIEKFEEYLNNGQIEPAHLSSLRGRDLKNCCILVDEAENLLTSNIQLLLGRVAENSEIIFCADVKQCDYQDEKMSGIPKMIQRLQGNALFGMIKLLKTERSKVAATADLLD